MSFRTLAKQHLYENCIVGEKRVSAFRLIEDETMKQTSYVGDNKALSCFRNADTQGCILQQETIVESFEERAAIIKANGISSELAEGLAALCVLPCPVGISVGRWEQLLDSAGRFLDVWKTYHASQPQ